MRQCQPCPRCGRVLSKRYSWRDILAAIFCFPCQVLCIRYRWNNRYVFYCKSCDIEVIIADDGLPDIYYNYNNYKEFRWQYDQVDCSSRNNVIDDVNNARNNVTSSGKMRPEGEATKNLSKNFSTSTELSYQTADENFENDSSSSFRTTTTSLTTPNDDNNNNNDRDNYFTAQTKLDRSTTNTSPTTHGQTGGNYNEAVESEDSV